MTPESWNRLQAQFELAVQLPPEQRPVLLARLAEQDPTIAGELEAMLEADIDISCTALGSSGLGRVVKRVAGEVANQQEPRRFPRRSSADITRLGAYLLERPLGRGGTAAVYRARRVDGCFKQTVAIKILEVEAPELSHRFRAELQILARLDHPNIVRLLDGGRTEAGLPYAVLEFVDGEPIQRFCERHNLSTEHRLALFRSLCSAIEHAHRHGIVHRDLKPANILVTRARMPKVLDFGIAKALVGADLPITALSTGTGTRLLTPAYASPEQHRGEEVTAASDIYALGLLLFTLLSDERPPPIDDTTDAQRLVQVQQRLRQRKVSARLLKVVAKALAPASQDRFSNAQELANAVTSQSLKTPLLIMLSVIALISTSALWLLRSWQEPTQAAVETLTTLIEQRAELATERARPAHDMRAAHQRLQDAIDAMKRGRGPGPERYGIMSSIDAMIESELGSAQLSLGRLKEARNHLTNALISGRESKPTRRDLALTLGLIELERLQDGKIHDTDAATTSRISHQPLPVAEPGSLERARDALHRSLREGGNEPGSEAYIRALLSALEASPNAVRRHVAMTTDTAWEARAHLLEARFFTHDPAASAAAFTAAIRVAPSEFHAHLGLCQLALSDRGLDPDAKASELGKKACQSAVRIQPDDVGAQIALSRLLAASLSNK